MPATTSPLEQRREAVNTYDFRRLQPHVRFGTASDKYAGWMGQIYPEHYKNRISVRKRKLGGQTFEERSLPIASVADYFEHFEVLELDFTFYRPLREDDGEYSNNYFVLEKYLDNAPDEAIFFLKAPQMFSARKLRRSRGGRPHYEENPRYLDARRYLEQFHRPAHDLLEDRLAGVIFEQEYQRVSDSPDPEANVTQLDEFFARLPQGEVQPHLELRSDHLLTSGYFDWLAERELGFVFSHWTWLPPIREQWARAGERFTAADGQVVTRLLTPRDMKYAEAYAKAYPFDRPVPELAETRQAQDMVLDVTALAYQAQAQDALLNVVCNNRAWGNAPSLAQAIARRILREEDRRR